MALYEIERHKIVALIMFDTHTSFRWYTHVETGKATRKIDYVALYGVDFEIMKIFGMV